MGDFFPVALHHEYIYIASANELGATLVLNNLSLCLKRAQNIQDSINQSYEHLEALAKAGKTQVVLESVTKDKRKKLGELLR